MQDIDLFDASAYGLSAAEAVIMDPQHRLVLEAAGEGMAAAAPHHAVPPAKMGVFIGISWTEYARMAADAGVPVTAYTAQGAVVSVCPGMLRLLRPCRWLRCLCMSALSAPLPTNARRHNLLFYSHPHTFPPLLFSSRCRACCVPLRAQGGSSGGRHCLLLLTGGCQLCQGVCAGQRWGCGGWRHQHDANSLHHLHVQEGQHAVG